MKAALIKAIDELSNALSEIRDPLGTMELELSEGKPILSLYRESSNDSNHLDLFFSIKESRLLLGVSMVKNPPFTFKESFIQPTNEVSLVATSKELTMGEISDKTKFVPTSGWSIGEKRGSRIMNFSHFEIMSPYDVITSIDKKLNELCDDLGSNFNGMRELKKLTKCRIVIANFQHISNIQGLIFKADTISKLSQFEIDLDHMLYVYD